MTFRTPRRRISPRTKRRYRALKDFLRRAVGASSQPDIKTNPSVEASVSDLQSKIIDIEQQLDRVSKHCQDLVCLEDNFRKDSENSFVLLQRDDGVTKNTGKCDVNLKDVETKVLYNTSKSQYGNFDKSNNSVNINEHDDVHDMIPTNHITAQNTRDFRSKPKSKKTRHQKNIEFDLFKSYGRIEPKYKAVGPIYSTGSFHSLVESGHKYYSNEAYSGHPHEKKYSRNDYTEPLILKEHRKRENTKRDLRNCEKVYDSHDKDKRRKRDYSGVDKDFIADIIKRQYRPVKLFSRRDSDFSQISAPVCRDREFAIRDDIQEGSELCSCCFDKHKRKKYRYIPNTDLSDMRSVFDTRLYTSKKNRRYKGIKNYIDEYNNTALYDTVPVKEKTSPKSRRKFAEENMIAYQYCKEVPPSPKSNRPRLNLKVQYNTDYENNVIHERYQKRKSSTEHQIPKKAASVIESEISCNSNPQKTQSKIINNLKSQRNAQNEENVGTIANFQLRNFMNEQTIAYTKDTTLNTQMTDSSPDKTDRTLCEIKELLQSFLLEIKQSTHCDKSDVMSKIEDKPLTQPQENINLNSNMIPNSRHSFNNYSGGQCGMPSFLPAFPNSCCYPVLPICPMNCLQNGYIVPSPSRTCICKSKEPGCPSKEMCCKIKTSEESNTNNETQELIKEIYKFVSQKPTSPITREENGANNTAKSKYEQRIFDKKLLTTRSVGGSANASRHDANVGTPNMKCYSKSCEAIGSRVVSDTCNTSYSDTILEKLSLQATQSFCETELSSEGPDEKVKKSGFKKVLNSLKLFKKKKKDVIEELSESENTVDGEVQSKPPFKQHITSYAMHGQEFFRPPPIPLQHCCRSPPSDFYGCEARNNYVHPELPYNYCNHLKHHPREQLPSPLYNSTKYPTGPPNPNDNRHYHHIPQVPLCLKEIEMKSIGTQSDRKVSVLRKFTKKDQRSQDQARGYSAAAAVKEKPNLWKTLREKAGQNNNNPMDYSFKRQKELAQGDMKLRNAILKKMFYKRNPFSPRNLIVQTLLGKDKSSFGDPPKMYRPRMFL